MPLLERGGGRLRRAFDAAGSAGSSAGGLGPPAMIGFGGGESVTRTAKRCAQPVSSRMFFISSDSTPADKSSSRERSMDTNSPRVMSNSMTPRHTDLSILKSFGLVEARLTGGVAGGAAGRVTPTGMVVALRGVFAAGRVVGPRGDCCVGRVAAVRCAGGGRTGWVGSGAGCSGTSRVAPATSMTAMSRCWAFFMERSVKR